MAMAFQRSFDLPVSILRPFNTFIRPLELLSHCYWSTCLGAAQVQLGLFILRVTSRTLLTLFEVLFRFSTITNAWERLNIGTGFEISIADTVDLIAEVMNGAADFNQTEERERPLRSEVDR